MANPMRGEATIAGTAQTLCYDFSAFCKAERLTGKKLPEIMTDMESGLAFTVLGALIWAGLQRHHSCTLEEAEEIISAAGLTAVTEALTEAMQAALPSGTKDENPPKKKGATG